MAKLKLSMCCFVLFLHCCVNYAAAAFVPDNRAALKKAVDDCLKETPDGSCPIFSSLFPKPTIRERKCSLDLKSLATQPQSLEECRTKCMESKDCRFFSHGKEFKKLNAENCYQCKGEPTAATMVENVQYDIYQLIQYGVIGTWDTSKIQDMNIIFLNWKEFNQDM